MQLDRFIVAAALENYKIKCEQELKKAQQVIKEGYFIGLESEKKHMDAEKDALYELTRIDKILTDLQEDNKTLINYDYYAEKRDFDDVEEKKKIAEALEEKYNKSC